MSGFSPEWLALREPVDHASRDPALAEALRQRFASASTATASTASAATVSVVDLGCGTGSNIRATHALLGPSQQWTLVDYDARLLAAARERLASWAESCTADGDGLALVKSGKRLSVSFRQADLNRDLDAALGPAPDLVTASALFDLCSEPFIARFAAAVAKQRAVFYTVLTYNGVQTWTPPHVADAAAAAAFHAHQKTDKGFGVSAGPDAPAALARAFRAAGYRVSEGDSPWRLGAAQQALVRDLAAGFAGAVAETGRLPGDVLADWRGVPRSGAVVGHTDTLAVPG